MKSKNKKSMKETFKRLQNVHILENSKHNIKTEIICDITPTVINCCQYFQCMFFQLFIYIGFLQM